MSQLQQSLGDVTRVAKAGTHIDGKERLNPRITVTKPHAEESDLSGTVLTMRTAIAKIKIVIQEPMC